VISAGLRKAEHLPRIGETRNAYTIFVGNALEYGRFEDVEGHGEILLNLRETGCEYAQFWLRVVSNGRLGVVSYH
jgi:hypothetical protein